MSDRDPQEHRSCTRRFTVLGDGGVRITWSCGARLDVLDETAVDVEILADHLPTTHHHHHHLPHPTRRQR